MHRLAIRANIEMISSDTTDISSPSSFRVHPFLLSLSSYYALFFLVYFDFLVNRRLSESGKVNAVEVKGVELRSGSEDAGRCPSPWGR
jgi:hypothetical protein